LVGELDKHTVAISRVWLSTFPIDFFHIENILGAAPNVFAVVAFVRPRRPQLNVHHWISYELNNYKIETICNKMALRLLANFERQACLIEVSIETSSMSKEQQ
jgi:hypothetical protein